MTNITTTSFSDGGTASSATMNANFASCETALNGGLDTTNFAADADIDASKLSPGTDGQSLAHVTTNQWKGGIFQIAVASQPSSTSLVFSSISSAFAVLYLVLSLRTAAPNATDDILLRFNGDSTQKYHGLLLEGGAGTGLEKQTSARLGSCSADNASGMNTRGLCTVFIPNYTSSNFKVLAAQWVAPSASACANGASRWTWASQAAITQIEIFNASWDFETGSRATLYGMG